MLYSNLDFLAENLGDVRDEHGERFQQGILAMKRRFKGKMESWNVGRLLLGYTKRRSFFEKEYNSCLYWQVCVFIS